MSARQSRRLLGARSARLDRVLGEPPDDLHPVAGFGSTMTLVEGRALRRRRASRAFATRPSASRSARRGPSCDRPRSPSRSAAAGRTAAPATACTIARRSTPATSTARAPAARARRPRPEPSSTRRASPPRSSSRSPRTPSTPSSRRRCGALAGGARGVLAHRAVNTMDAMVGHRSERYERFGWAAPALDDAAATGCRPGSTAALVRGAARRRRRVVRQRAADDAPRTRRPTPASPRPRSPARSGSSSAGRCGTATASRTDRGSGTGAAPDRARHRPGRPPRRRRRGRCSSLAPWLSWLRVLAGRRYAGGASDERRVTTSHRPGPHGGDGAASRRGSASTPSDVLDLSQALNPVAPDVAPLVARGTRRRAALPRRRRRATDALADGDRHRPGTAGAHQRRRRGDRARRRRAARRPGRRPRVLALRAAPPCGRPPAGPAGGRTRTTPPAGSPPHDARRGVGRGVLPAGHRHLDPRRRLRPSSSARSRSSSPCPGCASATCSPTMPHWRDASRAGQPQWSVGVARLRSSPGAARAADLGAWAVGYRAPRDTSSSMCWSPTASRPEPSDAPFVLVRAPGVRERARPPRRRRPRHAIVRPARRRAHRRARRRLGARRSARSTRARRRGYQVLTDESAPRRDAPRRRPVRHRRHARAEAPPGTPVAELVAEPLPGVVEALRALARQLPPRRGHRTPR